MAKLSARQPSGGVEGGPGRRQAGQEAVRDVPSDRPIEPYVRQVRLGDDVWHIAVRALGDGSVTIRCQTAPLVPPLDWRLRAPEASVDATTCRLCLKT
jgi:hypothetical protein